MDRTLFRYDEPYGRPRRKANLFVWTIVILLLIGFALAAWLGSYYIFSQPERADSYRILQKLHKIEQPKRFQLTAAPAGEFLNGKQLRDRYGAMRPAELAKTNAELARNFIRNYQQVRGQIQYVVGRYTIMDAHALSPNDTFTSGMVALTGAVDSGELLMEHVYPADEQSVPLMKQTLVPGLEIKLERSHDLSAVLHAERLADGRVLVTAVPLLYGSYTVTQGRGAFSLEPPFDLNLKAGWPIFKDDARHAAEEKFASLRERLAPASPVGLGPTPGPTAAPNELVRVEPAAPVETPKPAIVAGKAGPAAVGKLAKNQKPGVTPSATPAAVAKKSAPSASPVPVAATTPLGKPAAAASLSPAALSPAPAVAVASPAAPVATPLPISGDTTLASTAGGGTWKTYPAGKMPQGRLITPSDLGDVAQHGLAGERVYLRGQFVVNFAESNRAVLRPRSNLAESVLHFGAPSSTRIVVEFPAGTKPPAQGSTVNRDELRPYEITEVRRQSDGQLNVFVREIMQ
ncbi:MAG: hypothetical protein M3Z22_02480 [Verrucomicrobiota bacterium]|nr:hypothetical protein [Verrucomicrobiota bacterium]